MDHEHIYDQRTAATRGLVMASNDNGAVQTIDVQTHEGVLRAGVEVHHPFGFSSLPPLNGAVAVLIPNGADPSDMIALPAAVPLCRFGGLLPGESVLYADDASRVHIQQGGVIRILAATQVVITAPQVTITASGGVTLTGNVSITGTLSVSGDVSFGANAQVSGNLGVDGNIAAGGTISP